MIEFTQLIDKLSYPRQFKGELTKYHSDVVDYVMNNYSGTYSFRSKIVQCLNSISYHVLSKDSMDGWVSEDPLESVELVDDAVCQDFLGNLYLRVNSINWVILEEFRSEEGTTNEDVSTDIELTADRKPVTKEEKVKSSLTTSYYAKPRKPVRLINEVTEVPVATPKEDLYLKPPLYPQVFADRIWLSKVVDGSTLTIYVTYPEIPVKQNQISVTTDISLMTYSDLLKLFPNHVIHTRGESLYEKVEGLDCDEDLGVIIPISRFTDDQVADSIIRYPHFYKLMRFLDGKLTGFFNYIEIDGKLHRTLDVWDSLPEASKIPKQTEFIRDYVARRYLLERDVLGIKHKYPLFGSLDPFITLFMPPEGYANRGYSDSIELATSCVNSRVSFRRTRNPVLRRIQDV